MSKTGVLMPLVADMTSHRVSVLAIGGCVAVLLLEMGAVSQDVRQQWQWTFGVLSIAPAFLVPALRRPDFLRTLTPICVLTAGAVTVDLLALSILPVAAVLLICVGGMFLFGRRLGG